MIARAPQGTDTILYADVDFARNAVSHARQLFLQHRRPELYAEWLAAPAAMPARNARSSVAGKASASGGGAPRESK